MIGCATKEYCDAHQNHRCSWRSCYRPRRWHKTRLRFHTILIHGVPSIAVIGASNCGFLTIQQCRATVSGIGGFCEPNQFYNPGKPSRAPRTGKLAQARQRATGEWSFKTYAALAPTDLTVSATLSVCGSRLALSARGSWLALWPYSLSREQ